MWDFLKFVNVFPIFYFPAGDCWTSCCRPEGNQLWRTQWHSSKVPGHPKPLFPTGQSLFSRKLARLMFGTQRYVSNALYECCKFEQTAWMDDRVKKFVLFWFRWEVLALNSMPPVYVLFCVI